VTVEAGSAESYVADDELTGEFGPAAILDEEAAT